MKLPISAIVLTLNEEKNIKNCLESIYNLVGEIFIVDSGSTDKTIEIVRRYTDKIYYHPFQTHANQWSWAFKTLFLSYEWCLALDADQRIAQRLKDELVNIFEKRPDLDLDGFYINRRQIFRGKWIRFGGYYPRYLLRLFKVKKVCCDEKELVDKRFYVNGKTAKLKNDIIEENINENNISFWIEKHNRYSSLLAQEELGYHLNHTCWFIRPSLFGNSDQRILWLKNIYYHLPLYIRAFIYFFYRYFLRLGFLDGKEGFIFHFLQGFWYRLIVDIKIKEIRNKS